MDEFSRFCLPGYGERIKRIRVAHEMTQEEFAGILGVTRSTEAIWECEYEEIHPSRDAFYKMRTLAEEKNLKIEQLIEDPSIYIDDYEPKENDVEKEADTNSPWGDNLRASFVENCQDFCTMRLRRGRNI